MAQFTFDWFTPHSEFLWDATKDIAGKPGLRFLEIGCFEGMATLWFLQRHLTGAGSSIVCIDTFEGSKEHKDAGIDFLGTRERFIANTEPYWDRISLRQGESWHVLIYCGDAFDLIYVDGSHMACDVLADAVAAHPLLKAGGYLVFDDYGWGQDKELHERPCTAIDAFLACYAQHYRLVHKGYRVVLRKT